MTNKTAKKCFLGRFAIVAASISFLLSPIYSSGQTLTQTSLEDTVTRYEEYSRIFYRVQSRGLTDELITLEKYLTFLLKSVNNQLKKRKDFVPEDVVSLTPLELNQIALKSAVSDKNNIFAAKYEVWKNYQLNEIYLKIDKTVRLKRHIWERSSPSQRKDMFNYDLEAAAVNMTNVEETNYLLSIRIFDHILDFYDYKNIDDVLFYRSEAYYGSKQYVSAIGGYKRLMMEFPQSAYFQKSLYRCISIAYNSEDFEAVEQLFSVFEGKTASGWNFKKDVIYFIGGTGAFLNGKYEKAYESLSKVSEKSDYALAARYIAAHSLYRAGSKDEALNAFDDILLNHSADTLIWDETAITMGDILLAQENWDDAWGYYRLVPNTSPRFPRALFGQAVVRFFRAEYDPALTTVDSVLNNYANNNYRYQALCLKGAVLKNMGQPDAAQELYERVLYESGVKVNLVNYLTERLKIIYLVNGLRQKEEAVLATGNRDIFDNYWVIRIQSDKLLRRAMYSEVLEVDPGFGEYIKEKTNLINIVGDFSKLTDDVLASNNVKLLNKYRNLRDDLHELNAMIQASGYGRLQKLPFYYKVSEAEFKKKSLDSLYQTTSREIARLEGQLEDISAALSIADEDISLERRTEMVNVADRVRIWRKNLDRRISVNIDASKPLLELDLSRWSNIAFHKTLIPGADFNDLKDKRQRIEDIYRFLRTIDNITYRLGIEQE